jgi:tetrahydromethanopterin S-methyltransferase subunit B
MLPLVQIVPEYGLSLDPSTGKLGAASLISMEEVNEAIATVETAADELVNSLDPTTVSVGTYPGREGVYLTAGLLTNTAYGFLLGLFILIPVLYILNSAGVL